MTPVAAFITNILFLMLQSFVLTFLAEWGDRSQIATIAVRYDLVIVHVMFCEDFATEMNFLLLLILFQCVLIFGLVIMVNLDVYKFFSWFGT